MCLKWKKKKTHTNKKFWKFSKTFSDCPSFFMSVSSNVCFVNSSTTKKKMFFKHTKQAGPHGQANGLTDRQTKRERAKEEQVCEAMVSEHQQGISLCKRREPENWSLLESLPALLSPTLFLSQAAWPHTCPTPTVSTDPWWISSLLRPYRVRGPFQQEVDGPVHVLVAVVQCHHALILVLPCHLHQLRANTQTIFLKNWGWPFTQQTYTAGHAFNVNCPIMWTLKTWTTIKINK